MLDKLNVLTRIIEKIKRFPVTFESMKEWVRYENIEISDRTLYRYLKDTENVRLNEGQIITFNGDCNRKTWKFEYDNSQNELTENDILSLILMKGFFPDTLFPHHRNSVEKIEKIIYRQQSKSKFEYHYQPIADRRIIAPLHEKNYDRECLKILDQILWALLHHRKIQICRTVPSDASDKPQETKLPMQLICDNGRYILMCLSESESELDSIDIEDICDVEISNVPFDFNKYENIYGTLKNERFGTEKNINDKIYEIILVFDRSIKEKINRTVWHPSQKIKLLPNGNIELSFLCGINNELVRQILQWGREVQIRAPHLLLQKTNEYINDILCLCNSEHLV